MSHSDCPVQTGYLHWIGQFAIKAISIRTQLVGLLTLTWMAWIPHFGMLICIGNVNYRHEKGFKFLKKKNDEILIHLG